MRLSSRVFAASVLAVSGLAAFVLFAGAKQDEQLKHSKIPGFQTVGENRLRNLFRRVKVPIKPKE